MNEFPKFFYQHLNGFVLERYTKPTYAILGCREWKYFQEYLNFLDAQAAIKKTPQNGNCNPTFDGIQLLKSYEESVIIFVP